MDSPPLKDADTGKNQLMSEHFEKLIQLSEAAE